MNALDQRTPLWHQLQATANVLQSVRGGVSGTAAIEDVPNELRAAVQSLAFFVWRNLGRAEALRKQLASKTPPPAADALLCVALALGWQVEAAPYDDFTLVNQTVEAAKRNKLTQKQANFINACLRRFLRERDALVRLTDQDPVAKWNHPLWWIDRIRMERPDHWELILLAANDHAPMTLRVNGRQISDVVTYLKSLSDAGICARQSGPCAVDLDCPMAVQKLPGFAEGWISVQDGAAQLAAPLLLDGMVDNARLRVLDACAAPGGKTGHILEMCEADVTALEVDARRAIRIEQNLSRIGVSANIIVADATKLGDWWDGNLFDAILLDAPCTASGIVRRHPDVRWLRREEDVFQLAKVQRSMLQMLWPLVKPGGRLLYCTCSLFLAEGEGQVRTFLARNTDALLMPSPGHLLPGKRDDVGDLPDNQSRDHDGFFYALFQKKLA
jgi:16S rRNA (cytosine967-C5)-methyltransferase